MQAINYYQIIEERLSSIKYPIWKSDKKTLKRLANQTQQNSKMIICFVQVEFIPGR